MFNADLHDISLLDRARRACPLFRRSQWWELRHLPATVFGAVCISVFICITSGSILACTFQAPLPTDDEQSVTAEAPDADADADALASSASNAQNNSDFAFAEKQWTKLVQQFPDWSRVATAKLNLGICQFQQQKYAEAIEPIKAAVVSGDTTLNIPKALLFLGFAQMKHGDRLALADSTDDPTQAGIYLTTATQTFGKIVKEFSDYENADQALYFQGQAFYKLERYDEAIAAFESLDSFENARFKDVAKYDLANTYQQIGNDVAALAAYEQFRLDVPTDDTNTRHDVDLQIAKLKIKMAQGSVEREENANAQRDFEQANEVLQSIVDSPDSNFWAEARFNQAIIAGQIGDFERSADLYTQVAKKTTSPFAAQAAVLAGRERIRADDHRQAIDVLIPIAENDSRYSLQAAILLANAYRNDGNPQKSETLTAQWLEKSKDSNLHVALLMERAEAAYATPKKKKLAGERFLNIATQFPKNSTAAEALYNATVAFWESYETQQAINSANTFRQRFPQSPFYKDIIEILGDASLVTDDYTSGEQLFRQLYRSYPNDDTASKWTLRIGWALYLQNKHAEAEIWLVSKLADVDEPKIKSEALHWIGASQYQQKKYRDAVSFLSQSIDSIERWEGIDETMLALLRSEIAIDDIDQAQAIGAKIANQFPGSPAAAESLLRLGEARYDRNDFKKALVKYEQLLAQFPDSEFVPTAMFGKGWSQLRSGLFQTAEQTFTEVIERFPGIELAQQARMGRSVAHRKLGKSTDAIKDLQTFLATAPQGEPKINSQFELGLAYVENDNWLRAEEIFRDLLSLPDSHRLADRAQYELAWVLAELNQPQASEEQFSELTRRFPESPFVGDANFKVASALYDRQSYQDAAQVFQQVLITPNITDELAEKTRYKLGWCFYKQEKFSDASATFEAQTREMPSGALVADGSFMLAQSLFENADYSGALQAYTAARPILTNAPNAPERLTRLTMINGAKSANAEKAWQQAIEFATPLTTTGTEGAMVQAAWLEIGKARMGLNEAEGALDAWTRASNSIEKIGAEARVLKGDLLFQQRRFAEAINEFKLVFYGYGGSKSSPEIRPLQAYAVYEAARCSYVQISEAPARLKPKLIGDAQSHFQYLIENYPEQSLASQAKQQLEALKLIRPTN